MPIATPKKCYKCGKIKLIGDCGMPICNDCKSNKNKITLKSAIKEWIKDKIAKKAK